MLNYKALDKEVDVVLNSFSKEDLRIWLDSKNKSLKMKNIPKFVYLQTGLEEYGETCSDFNELNSNLISWCADKIYEDDLQFISVSSVLARIKELEKDVYIDEDSKRSRVKELKKLIK